MNGKLALSGISLYLLFDLEGTQRTPHGSDSAADKLTSNACKAACRGECEKSAFAMGNSRARDGRKRKREKKRGAKESQGERH